MQSVNERENSRPLKDWMARNVFGRQTHRKRCQLETKVGDVKCIDFMEFSTDLNGVKNGFDDIGVLNDVN